MQQVTEILQMGKKGEEGKGKREEGRSSHKGHGGRVVLFVILS